MYHDLGTVALDVMAAVFHSHVAASSGSRLRSHPACAPIGARRRASPPCSPRVLDSTIVGTGPGAGLACTCSPAVALSPSSRRMIHGMKSVTAVRPRRGCCRVVQPQALIPVRRIYQHQARDLVGKIAGEVLHVQSAEGMPDQDVGGRRFRRLSSAAQLADYRGGVPRAERRVASIVPGSVVGPVRAQPAAISGWISSRRPACRQLRPRAGPFRGRAPRSYTT